MENGKKEQTNWNFRRPINPSNYIGKINKKLKNMQ